jgi:hypothetical protein
MSSIVKAQTVVIRVLERPADDVHDWCQLLGDAIGEGAASGGGQQAHGPSAECVAFLGQFVETAQKSAHMLDQGIHQEAVISRLSPAVASANSLKWWE